MTNTNEPNLEAADQDAAGTPEPHIPDPAVPAAPLLPLTDEQIENIWRDFIGASWLDKVREVERACAEKWGVKLAGIGTKEPGK